jgi:hypothetical protein
MKVLSPRISGAVRRQNHRDHRPADHEIRDLLSWSRHYLPSHFTKPPSPMHKWLAAELDELAADRGRKVNLVGPRGHAKSTIATLAYPLRQILQRGEHYIWIVSDTAHQAQMHLENIRWELTDNERLAEDYSKRIGRGQKWSAGSMRLASGVVVEAYGTGQRIRGKRAGAHRPSLIICDDLQNDGHIASVAQREASRAWFHGTLLRAGNSLTNVINLGTALHRDALAMVLTRTPGWRTRTFAAIELWPVRKDLWEEWERIYCDLANPQHVAAALAFYEAHRDEMHAGAEVLWPEEEDLLALMRIRVESGRTAFEREKQSRPIDPERCEWPDEYFGDHIWFDEWPDGLAVRVIALDPSKGTDARHGDYSAFVLFGMDHDGMFFVEANLVHLPTPELVDEGVRLARDFRPHVFGVEANLFQVLLARDFQAAFNREGLVDVRVEPIDNHVAKIVRIRRLGRYLSQRRFRFLRNSTGARLVVDQLRDFPLGSYDDGPDALEMAERLADRHLLGRIAPNDGLGNQLI